MIDKIILRNSEYEPNNGLFIRRDGSVESFQVECSDSITIYLECRGALLPYSDGKFYPVKLGEEQYFPDTMLEPAKYFHEYCQQNRWNGFIYHEAYTTAQLESLRNVIVENCDKYGITTTYNKNMWNVMNGPGIYADRVFHEKSTNIVHPQPELVTLLKSL